MPYHELVNKLLDKALECADRNDFEKCEQATRILLSLPTNDSALPIESNDSNPELDEQEALENLELVDDSFRGQLWMTISEACQAFAIPKHELEQWAKANEVEWQPRPNDKRGTRLFNSISIAARIDRGHCPPNCV